MGNTMLDDVIGLHLGSKGEAVRELQEALAKHNFNPGKPDGNFGPHTQSSLINFQKSQSLAATGSVDTATATALGITAVPYPDDRASFTVDKVWSTMFKSAPHANVEKYLPDVLNALYQVNLADKSMILMALSTIRAETGNFIPISEYESTFNTPPGGIPYSLYDFRKDLGNDAKGDGSLFKGRGFVQLTGRNNYTFYSQLLGLGTELVQYPDMANDGVIAARILAQFLKRHEVPIRNALSENPIDYATARRSVNGGTNGLEVFTIAFKAGNSDIA
jgi:predicted chitinase